MDGSTSSPEKESPRTILPLSIFSKPTVRMPSLDTARLSPCEWACGTCTTCRVFDALQKRAA